MPIVTKKLVDDGDYAKMLNAALRFLSIRPRSRVEIEAYLNRKAVTGVESRSTLVAKVLAKLKELNFVNDFDFAKWLFEQRSSGRKPKGALFIKRELAKMGVSREISDQIFVETSSVDWKAEASRLVSKKLRVYGDLPNLAKRQKLYNFLLRSGYSFDLVKDVVDEALKVK